MFLVGILSWWYGDGWLSRIKNLKGRLVASADFFSVGLLAKTIFAPFRQISAGKVSGSGSLSAKWQALIDRTISRFIGAFVRISMIIIGLVVMFFQIVLGIAWIVVWPVVPFLVVIGLILTVIGWVPTWTI